MLFMVLLRMVAQTIQWLIVLIEINIYIYLQNNKYVKIKKTISRTKYMV